MLAAEREQLPRQARCTRGGAHDCVYVLADLGIDTLLMTHDLGISLDNHEQVVEVVRDSASQSPHGLHLLRLSNLLLQASAAGYIARGNDNAAHSNIVQQIVSHRFQPYPGVIFAAKAEFGRSRTSHFEGESLQRGPHCQPIVRMHKGQEVASQEFRRFVSRDALDGGAMVKHGPIYGHNGDDVRKILNEIAEPLFASPQNSSGFLTLADVAKDSEDDWSSAQLRRTCAELHGNTRTINVLEFQFAAMFTVGQLGEDLPRFSCPLRIKARFRYADNLPFGDSKHFGSLAVRLSNEARFTIDYQNRVVGGIDEVAIFLLRVADPAEHHD